MSGGFPLLPSLGPAISTADKTASCPIQLTSAAPQYSYGAWTQLNASLPFDVCFAMFQVGLASNLASDSYFVQLGVGANGSEVPIASFFFPGNIGQSFPYVSLPLSIPAGTRISARLAASAFGPFTDFFYGVFFSGDYVGQGVAGTEILGWVNGTAPGVSVTPSATPNVMGLWTQVFAATQRDYLGLIPVVVSGAASSSGTALDHLLDIGIGPNGSELAIIPGLYARAGQFNSQIPNLWGFFPRRIPSGTRLAARCQQNGTAQDACGVLLIGVF